jgi:hypothetical protein
MEKFAVFVGGYATCPKYVYYNGFIIDGADPKTFRVIVDSDSYGYARDKKNVYYFGDIIQGADPETFEVYPNDDYATDKNAAWFRGNKICDL